MDKNLITIDKFSEVEIKIGKVLQAEKVENADKLIKLSVDFGGQTRQIISGIADFFEPSYLVGKEFPFVINLETKKLKGLESQGMILAIEDGDKPVLLIPEKEVTPGSKVG